MPNISLIQRAARRAEARGRALTVADLREDPSRLVTPLDLVEAGFIRSYSGLAAGLKAGTFPEPLPDPLGGKALRWTAGAILDAYGLLPEAEQATAA